MDRADITRHIEGLGLDWEEHLLKLLPCATITQKTNEYRGRTYEARIPYEQGELRVEAQYREGRGCNFIVDVLRRGQDGSMRGGSLPNSERVFQLLEDRYRQQPADIP